jgi:hypothetical protein
VSCRVVLCRVVSCCAVPQKAPAACLRTQHNQHHLLLTRTCYSFTPSCSLLYYLILLQFPVVIRTAQSVQWLSYLLDDKGSHLRQRPWSPLFSETSKPAMGTVQRPTQCLCGLFPPGLKRLGCEATHFLPCNAEEKNEWSYTYTVPYAFMA